MNGMTALWSGPDHSNSSGDSSNSHSGGGDSGGGGDQSGMADAALHGRSFVVLTGFFTRP